MHLLNLKDVKMSKLNLTALLLGAALFTALGAVNLSASSKCGADHMKKSAGKCGGAKKSTDAKKAPAKKCGAGKCGSAKKAPAKMKCGAGKCGGSSRGNTTKCG